MSGKVTFFKLAVILLSFTNLSCSVREISDSENGVIKIVQNTTRFQALHPAIQLKEMKRSDFDTRIKFEIGKRIPGRIIFLYSTYIL